MDPILLLLDLSGFALVLLWAARRRGDVGLFAWRENKAGGACPDRGRGGRAPRSS